MFAGEFSGLGSSKVKMTTLLVICCVVASTGGFVSGYCLALTGPYGFLSRESFLNKFKYQRKMKKNLNPNTSTNYCLNDNFKEAQLLIYSFFSAALTASFLASYTTRRLGRRHSMLIAGIFFMVGSILSTTSQNLAMLVIGMVLLGCGVGFAYQAIPIYLLEIAPTKIRGALNILFQLNVTVGGIFGDIVGFGIRRIKGEWGLRLLMGLTGIFALIFTIGAFFIVETPNSLIEHGYLDKGKEVLRKIRDTNNNIEPEILELVEASNVAKQVKYPFKNLLKKRNMPPLIITLVFQTFYSFSGINTIRFYMQVFLQTIGYDVDDVSLYSNVTTKIVNVIVTIVSMLFVDKIGRRKLLLEASLHMFLSHFLIAIILGIKVKDHSSNISNGSSTFVVIQMCTFLSSFSWSWGALRWLIPSEIFPLETRSIGQSASACIFFMSILIRTQTSNQMLCSFKFGVFFFFSGWIVIMSLFVYFFLPETKNIPIEDMKERVWERHWFWKKFLNE